MVGEGAMTAQRVLFQITEAHRKEAGQIRWLLCLVRQQKPTSAIAVAAISTRAYGDITLIIKRAAAAKEAREAAGITACDHELSAAALQGPADKTRVLAKNVVRVVGQAHEPFALVQRATTKSRKQALHSQLAKACYGSIVVLGGQYDFNNKASSKHRVSAKEFGSKLRNEGVYLYYANEEFTSRWCDLITASEGKCYLNFSASYCKPWWCPRCLIRVDRDINAAVNMLTSSAVFPQGCYTRSQAYG
ncbi:hypothetical protein H9P43_009979 [Blastocladiella emersonii ATCC 22665]|nr:hypothetical protein H9P43_009979 [Blastocladiella emersonii ATCC 22665]